jgi:hypothetical protein
MTRQAPFGKIPESFSAPLPALLVRLALTPLAAVAGTVVLAAVGGWYLAADAARDAVRLYRGERLK